MGITKSPKSQKGTVVLETFRERLRLRWRHASKRYALALGYPDDKPHRKLAEARAREIQADLDLDRFDVTLNKYKRQGQLSEPSESSQRMVWHTFDAPSVSRPHIRVHPTAIAVADHPTPRS